MRIRPLPAPPPPPLLLHPPRLLESLLALLGQQVHDLLVDPHQTRGVDVPVEPVRPGGREVRDGCAAEDDVCGEEVAGEEGGEGGEDGGLRGGFRVGEGGEGGRGSGGGEGGRGGEGGGELFPAGVGGLHGFGVVGCVCVDVVGAVVGGAAEGEEVGVEAAV